MQKNKIEATQDMVNKALEGLCSIPQTKRHAQKFEQSERSGDCGLCDILRNNRDLVKSMHLVNSREYFLTGERNSTVVDVRNRIAVRYYHVVQSMIIAARMPVTRHGFQDHMKRCGPAAFRWANNAQLQHVLEFGFRGSKFFRAQMVRAGKNRRSRCTNVMHDVVPNF